MGTPGLIVCLHILRVCMHISICVFLFPSQVWASLPLSLSVYPPWRGSWENRWHCGTGSSASLPTGPLLRSHLAGIASVLIRGSTDATLHLPTVTQPGSADADEVNARNRRLGISHRPPLLFCFVQQDMLGGEKQHPKVCGKRIKVEKQQPDGFRNCLGSDGPIFVSIFVIHEG